MKILVLNSGSSSIKYQLFEMPERTVLCTGLVDKIGQIDCLLKHKLNGNTIEFVLPDFNHRRALSKISEVLVNTEYGALNSPEEVEIVGHRVVHGGEEFSDTVIIDSKVKERIKDLFALAPLHNPSNYNGIEVSEKVFSKAKQIAVFDTSFHSSIPEYAYRYAIPNEFYQTHGIRTYGFHGTSHKFVSNKAHELFSLETKKSKVITIHLGNGCSMAAIKNGQCIDTTMGLSPLAGLVMGTRSGDIDPSVIFHLTENGYDIKEISKLLNKESGLKGLSGQSDMRTVKTMAKEGNEHAKLALEIYAYRIKKYLGAYTAILNGLDAIIFTGGVGENDEEMRTKICNQLDHLGIAIDSTLNSEKSDMSRNIASGKVKVLIVPTNEELEIAEQCYSI